MHLRKSAWWVAVILALAPLTASAQAWPAKPIRVIVPFAPGGPADITARLIGQPLAESLGQQLLIDNRAGAGGNIGAVAAAKSPSDGYTLLVTTSALAVNASLFANPGYDVERDFAPVANIATQPNLIYVNAATPPKNLAELLSLAKSSKFSFASPGSGTTPHLTAENLFKVAAKVDVPPVHYRGGGPAVAAVVAGEPPIGSGAISGPLPHVKSGKLRALAVSSARRVPALPDVPTLAELGFPGMEDYTWVGLFAPAGTPSEIVQKLNDAVNRALANAEVRERLSGLAFEPVGGPQQAFAEYVKAEVVKWGKVVKDTGARPD